MPEFPSIEGVIGNRYQIIRELGAGAFGAVYLARERQLHRTVAIKVLHRERAWSDDERARLLREARTIANLSHPAIVQLLAFEDTDEATYMVMPFVAGVTLDELLRTNDRLDPEDARRMLIEIADALAYAHGEGVLHRDLKPENVLLERAGATNDPAPPRVRLIDFGVAAFPGRDHGVNAADETWGTPRFMAPEQLLGEKQLDSRTDLYALGVLGYLMLAGRMPFDATSPMERLQEQQRGPRIPLSEAARDAPSDLVRAIDKCLAFDIHERWRHARDLRDALLAGAEPTTGAFGLSLIRQRLRPRRAAIERFAARRRRAAPTTSAGWTKPIFRGGLHDLSYAWRQLRKRPLFTVAAVLTLGVGIGAATAVYSAVNAVLLHPLPLPGLDRVMLIREQIPSRGYADADLDPAESIALMHATDTFSAVGGYFGWRDVVETGLGAARPLTGTRVLGDFFGVFDVHPLVGQFFHGADFQPGHRPIAVISYRLWTSLGADRAIVGKTIDLSGTRFEIVGVAPETFRYPLGVDYWQPFPLSPRFRGYLGLHAMTTLVRLRPEISAARLDGALPAMLARAHPNFASGMARPRAHPFVEAYAGSLAPVLRALLAAVVFVLLITCANIGSLYFVHLTARVKELAVRTALGASRARLVRQLAFESLVLAAGGCVLGVALGAGALRVLSLAGSLTVPALASVQLNGRVLVAAIGASIVCALLFGVFPAMRSSRVDLRESLSEAGRPAHLMRRRFGMLRTAVVIQIAAALVLTLGATLMIRTVNSVLARSTGFAPDIRTLRVHLPDARAEEALQRLSQALPREPGIERVGFTTELPFSSIPDLGVIAVPGMPGVSDSARADVEAIAGDYFGAMGIPRLAGRLFSIGDNATAAHVVVVDEPFVRKFLMGAPAVGVQIQDGARLSTIVGVVGGVTRMELAEASPSATVYYPYDQRPMSSEIYLATRTRLPLAAVRATVGRVGHAIDPSIVTYDDDALARRMDTALAPRRLTMTVLAGFGGLALLLAIFGSYAVMSYVVSERSSEFGLRMALGARSSDVLRLVLRQGALIGGAGVTLGLLAAVIATPTLQALLYGVSSHDVVTFVGVSLPLALFVLAASCAPAYRASRVDPAATIRGA